MKRDDHRPARRWDYLPLGTATITMLVLLAILPSALHLPQTNPAETLEYAPVPPDDDAPASQEGNFSSLGLGSSRSLGNAATGTDPSAPVDNGGIAGVSKNPSTKRCVGNPPRQTEDPMSPPCVAYFDGDNGGATAIGVTGDEVVILVYKDGEDNPGITGPTHDYWFDMDQPQTQEERDAIYPGDWRNWQRYFNDRYQTYGRHVHIYYHLGSLNHSPEQRHADVAEAISKVNPFAVVALVNANGEVYVQDWARRGKVVFSAPTLFAEPAGVDQSFYRKYPGRIWGFRPSMQQAADGYSGFLCAQLVPHPVSFAGDGTNGQPRKFGLLIAGGRNQQTAIEFGKTIRRRIEACGGTVVAEEPATTTEGATQGLSTKQVQMASMRQAGVTTIVFAVGFHIGYTNSIGQQTPPWRPELIFVEQNVGAATSLYEDQDVMRYARQYTVYPRAARQTDQPCWQARYEANPEPPHPSGDYSCDTYPHAQMLFTGIQVAGPRLTIQTLDRGFHAIPPVPSSDPSVPACFFKPGDYTCVKDAQRQWWDPTGRADAAYFQGCWRSMEGGARFLAEDWPVRDLETSRDVAGDGCNVQGAQ